MAVPDQPLAAGANGLHRLYDQLPRPRGPGGTGQTQAEGDVGLAGAAGPAGARQLIVQAVEAVSAGRKRLVRHGHLPEREVQTGIAAVQGGRLKFTSTILPPYPWPGSRCLQR